MQGPPASGKSTWTKKFMEENSSTSFVVSRDAIRHSMGEYNHCHEDEVTRIEEALEITRLKNVDTDLIKKCYGELAYALYNSCMKYRSDKLTKEEFDLVKEWLEK